MAEDVSLSIPFRLIHMNRPNTICEPDVITYHFLVYDMP